MDIMDAMNYGFDNPNERKNVKIDEELINIASKSVMNPKVWEDITMFASMSKEEKAYKVALEQYKNAVNMNNSIKSKVA